MKTENKVALKQVMVILTVGIVAFIVWEIIKAIRAGASDLKSILAAPFNALGSVWTAVTGLFSGSGSSVATPTPGTIVDAFGNPIGTVATTSPFYTSFAPTAEQAQNQAESNYLLGTVPAGNAPDTIDWSNYPTS